MSNVNHPEPGRNVRELDLSGKPEFCGDVYEPTHDKVRLTGQILRVFECMQDCQWRTLDDIHRITGDPHASISAQLRHLRKPRFGSYVVQKRPRGNRDNGLWEYRLEPEKGQMELTL